MNTDVFVAPDPEEFAVDSATLDRLVDGSLDPTMRRQVLEALDQQSDGWRRCALAFLEAEAWREALGGQPDALEAVGPHPAQLRRARFPKPRQVRPALWRIARAAGVLLVFALGWLAARAGSPLRDSHLAGRSWEPSATPKSAIAESPAPAPAVRPESQETAPSRELAKASRTSLASLKQAIPPQPRTDDIPAAFRKELAAHGYQVETARELATVTVGAGRKLAVPVQGMRIRYVGDQTY
jgi:hypothetical protein